MKPRVPAAPRSTYSDAVVATDCSASFFARRLANPGLRAPGSQRLQLLPLSDSFLEHSAVASLALGVVGAFCLARAMGSAACGCSFVAGVLLSVTLLHSQRWFVRRLVAEKAATTAYIGWDAKLPLAFLVACKFIAVVAALALAFSYRCISPGAFAAGVTLLQVVIFTRVAGRLLHATMRPIAQVYIDDAKTA